MDDRIISTSVLTLSRQQEEFLARYRTHESQKAYFESYGLGVTPFFRGGVGSHGVIPPSPEPAFPYDYEVEYIQSDTNNGYSYIDTGIVNNDIENKYYVRMEYVPKETDNGNTWLTYPRGYNQIDGQSGFNIVLTVSQGTYYLKNLSYYGFKYVNAACSLKEPYYGIFDFEVSESEQTFKINGQIFRLSAYDRIPNSETIKIFSIPSSGKKEDFRLYSFKATIGTIILIDLIPVAKDGVGYMYDKVSEKLFGAEGGGQFIVGPRK